MLSCHDISRETTDGNAREWRANREPQSSTRRDTRRVTSWAATSENADDLTWNMHVDSIVKKAAKMVYMLYQLKRAGIRQTDLVNVYISVVRPFLEYACPVWHTNLPKYLSDNIEIIQKRALKSIFPTKGYDDILYDLGMCTLHERRNVICEQYF